MIIASQPCISIKSLYLILCQPSWWGNLVSAFNPLQSFVCFSACLFTRRLDGLKTAPSLYRLPANATCKDFCAAEVSIKCVIVINVILTTICLPSNLICYANYAVIIDISKLGCNLSLSLLHALGSHPTHHIPTSTSFSNLLFLLWLICIVLCTFCRVVSVIEPSLLVLIRCVI